MVLPLFTQVWKLSDRQAKDIYAFVRSLKLNAPAIEDVPTLKKIVESAERPYKP